VVQHRLIEIVRDHPGLYGKPRHDGPGQNARSGSCLQHTLWLGAGDPLGEIARIGLENERDEEPVIEFGN
jgi:hypothetical protein